MMKQILIIAVLGLVASANFYEQLQGELKDIRSQHVLKELLGELKALIATPAKKVLKPSGIPHYVHVAFAGFKAKFNRVYEGTEHQYRLKIFFDNLKFIEEFYRGPKKSYTIGITAFADMTHEEFKEEYVGGLRIPANHERKVTILPELTKEQVAAGVDWRTKGIVNPVKNQEQCGSCWAFSAVAAMEGAYAQKTGSLKSFSEQQLVDCSKSFGNHGCQGGLMDFAFKYAESNKMEQESDYRYTARNGVCQYKSAEGVFNTNSYTDVAHNSPSQLQSASSMGVVSIAIEADKQVFQHYTGGVINSSDCGTRLDHGVAVVGFTSNSFIVRNSWGPSWGDRGYVQISNSA
jgi:C1A family cysteine protease